jgi:hypothetical protein
MVCALDEGSRDMLDRRRQYERVVYLRFNMDGVNYGMGHHPTITGRCGSLEAGYSPNAAARAGHGVNGPPLAAIPGRFGSNRILMAS